MNKYREQYRHAEPELWGRVEECMGSNSALDKRMYRAIDKEQNNANVINSASYVLALDGSNVPDEEKQK